MQKLAMKIFLSTVLIFLCLPGLAECGAADRYNEAALNGLSETKVVFDINQGNLARLLLRLKFVQTIWNQLNQFGTTPRFVLALRGKASRTTGEQYVHSEDLADKHRVEEWLETFSKQGMALEQCALAAGLQKIDINNFLPQITVIANGYISLIGHQKKTMHLCRWTS